nr:hypothetical protein [Rhodoferax sediminis]
MAQWSRWPITTRSSRGGRLRGLRLARQKDTVTDKIDYIDAHDTSTPVGDTRELEALRIVFGRRACGHLFLVDDAGKVPQCVGQHHSTRSGRRGYSHRARTPG